MMKKNGKTKSEKVPVRRSLGVGGRTSLLFALSLLLFIFAAPAAMAGASVSVGTPQQRYPWNGKMDIPYALEGTDAAKPYWLVTAVTVEGATKQVTNELGQVTDGGYTNTVDCAALFGTAVAKERAAVKLALLTYDKPAIAITPVEKLYGPFLIINLTLDANGKFLTTECDYTPEGAWSKDGGWTDAYKTRYLVLRKVEAGTYPAFDNMTTKTTSGYWIGVFEVTEGQYDRVMGVASPSDSLVAKSQISYETIRGTADPSATVCGTSFMANLCAKCIDAAGKAVTDFDLPTEWQWNIAYNAQTTTTYYWGSNPEEIDQYAWYTQSKWDEHGGSGTQGAQAVGLKKPNAWGLYDIAGNVQEWCRDVFNEYAENFKAISGADQYNTEVAFPPSRPLRGGTFLDDVSNCAGCSRHSMLPSNVYAFNGFRLSRMSSK